MHDTGNNTIKQVEYLDGFQYAGGELQFFPTSEGYVNVTLGTTGNRIFNYVYYYTDHLGNIRMTYTKDEVSNELKIMDENHYYPFGLKHQLYLPGGRELKAIDEDTARPGYVTRTEWQYKYNGKEFQDELGLNMYAMDMRQYDPAIARWVVLDPVIHHSMSPYNAFDNNPVFWADPSGADSAIFEQGGTSYSSITTATGMSISAGGAGDNSTSEENKTSATSVKVDENGNRIVSNFSHTYEKTNLGGTIGDDIIQLIIYIYSPNGQLTQQTTSRVIVNGDGKISSQSTSVTIKDGKSNWQTLSTDKSAFGLTDYANAVSSFKSADKSSPLHYQSELNKEYNKEVGNKNYAKAEIYRKIGSIAAGTIPYVGEGVSEAFDLLPNNAKRPENLDDIGIKVIKEGQYKPTIQFIK